jgi:putative NIF3 family GTP cyclohydrolase 1 type 2
MKMKDLIYFIKNKLNISNVRVAGWNDGTISNVAVFCGSYDPDILEIAIKKSDVLVTGDLKYHYAVDIIENGYCVIDAGHFNTEKIMVQNTAKMLKEKFSDVEVICNNVETDPLKYY